MKLFTRLLVTALAGASTQLSAQARVDAVPLPATTREGIEIMPSIRMSYEDNVLRSDPDRAPKEDDFILTPAVTATLRQTVGRHSFAVGGSAGYDVYLGSTLKNKPRLFAGAEGRLAVGGYCAVIPMASFRRERSDYGDINEAVDNIQEYSNANVTLTCPRPSGIYPSLTYDRKTTRNSQRFEFADQTTDSVIAGVGFRKPQLGDVMAYYRHDHVDRPTLGLVNKTDQVGLSFIREISSLIQLHSDVQWLRVRSTDNGIRDYDGLGWAVTVSTRAIPDTLVSFTSGRRIVNDSLAAAGYAIQTSYGASAQVALSELTSVRLTLDYRRRSFRQSPNFTINTLETDKFFAGAIGLRRKMTERLSLLLEAGHFRRRADNGGSNYNANRATIGAEMRF